MTKKVPTIKVADDPFWEEVCPVLASGRSGSSRRRTPLRKLYLCFFWNDICKVMYKDMYWGAKRLRDWNQETEMDGRP